MKEFERLYLCAEPFLPPLYKLWGRFFFRGESVEDWSRWAVANC